MASEEAREQYRRRGRIVEFCHAWIKSKLGLRQLRAGPEEGADRNVVGLPYPQPAALDPPEKAQRHTGRHLREKKNSEENRDIL
jgi:hypothetical protein